MQIYRIRADMQTGESSYADQFEQISRLAKADKFEQISRQADKQTSR